ncbi:MAG: Flp pilus assembly complex ATPase component TadA [Candidatus Omnitrophica bacterium]|nr:Flp pilus assembly complex ATPase component TadA [Candidatus Omnitrophota bacterium]
MIRQIDKNLAKEIIKRKLLDEQGADSHLMKIQSSNDDFKTYLIRNKILNEKDVLAALATVLNLETVDLKDLAIEKSVIDLVPVRFSWYFKVMPIKVKGKKLTIACSSVLDIKSQDELRLHLGLDPVLVLASEADVKDALNKYYGLAADTVDRLAKDQSKQKGADEPAKWVEDLESDSEDATVAKLVNQILFEAYKKRATDIHIEPYRNKIRVRYRIDGVLIDANVPEAVKHFFPSIISRIKIMADLSIVEKRLPQDGSALVKTKEQDLDLRISTIPTPHGESMVIRLLRTKVMLLSLESLGLDRSNLRAFRQIINKPHGIILVTGPTGSGKTTTLYACLNAINSDDRKIITLEDPIEYEMEGITQIQVNPKIELSFATGLRSTLRHDPDIIMVGEVRDLETAEIAIRTALTGHLVFSTLHTNDAASGVTRLVEMGLEPFLVSSSIEAFVAQRLIRVICTHCKEEVKTPLLEIREEITQSLRLKDVNEVKLYQGRGCDHCNHTGFYGQTAIYEVLVMNDDIKAAVLEKKRADHIKQIAIYHGMVTLRQAGWQKVVNGVTTPEEVINVAERDVVMSAENAAKEGLSVSLSATPPADNLRVIKRAVLNAKNEYDSRIYKRTKEKVEIRYSLVKQDKDDPHKLITEQVEHSSVTKDISAGGLRFVTGYTIPKDTVLDLKIVLDKKEPSVNCLAKICRVEEDDLTAMFNLCVYFLDLSSGDRARIEQFVREKSGPDSSDKT